MSERVPGKDIETKEETISKYQYRPDSDSPSVSKISPKLHCQNYVNPMPYHQGNRPIKEVPVNIIQNKGKTVFPFVRKLNRLFVIYSTRDWIEKDRTIV